MLKVFLAVKYFNDGLNKPLIENIVSLLNGKGCEVTCIAKDIEKWGEVTLSPHELVIEAFNAIDSCDVVLLEFSRKGIGLGIEAGYAYALKKPIIAIASKNAETSKTLEGISSSIFNYGNVNDLDHFFGKMVRISEQKEQVF